MKKQIKKRPRLMLASEVVRELWVRLFHVGSRREQIRSLTRV